METYVRHLCVPLHARRATVAGLPAAFSATRLPPPTSTAVFSCLLATHTQARARTQWIAGTATNPDAAAWAKAMDRVAGQNAVVAGVLSAKVGQEGEAAKVAFEFGGHAYFPSVALAKGPAKGPAAAAAPAEGKAAA